MPEPIPRPDPLRDEWIARFLQHLATDRGASGYTSRNYREALADFFLWHHWERKHPPVWQQLERDDFRAYLRFLGRTSLAGLQNLRGGSP
ncbi:MAG TPA: site-specific integrase, partial [Clostridia bacterium]|nr:site-specific integrase [Clostridia bacterium]